MPHKLPYKEFLRQKLASQVERELMRLYPDDEARRTAFAEAFMAARAEVPAVIWLTGKPSVPLFKTKQLTDWQPRFVDVVDDPTKRPSRLPAYADGAYYPLDFSSVATVSALMAIQEPVESVLDVCSAPGGKAIFASRLFNPELLVCNEVIGKRHAALYGNLNRCQIKAEVIQQDPKQLPAHYADQMDLVIVDAPCSGQSLPARGIEAAGAFQDHLINANMKRQRRILAHSLECVAPGGHLMYSTCTYSREENEKNVEWLLRRFPGFTPVEVPYLVAHRSTLIDAPCYRIEPQQGIGAGGFVALFKRNG